MRDAKYLCTIHRGHRIVRNDDIRLDMANSGSQIVGRLCDNDFRLDAVSLECAYGQVSIVRAVLGDQDPHWSSIGVQRVGLTLR